MRIAGRIAGAVAALTAIIFAASPSLAAMAAQAATRKAAGPAGVAAHWAELANAATGKVLWSRDATRERPMGSITKVMTAYLVIKAGRLHGAISVPKGITAYDDEFDASTAGLVPGEKYTALQLLYALMLPSGCDAAFTLATAYGTGHSRAKFVSEMNATARKLGLTRTHFTDFSGLPTPSGTSTYSTPRDLVVLGTDAMKLAVFRKIVATHTFKLTAGGGHAAHTWTNLNPLLGHYSGAIGIKTGQTSAAGACLLFEARRGLRTLIGVVLHSSTSFSTGLAQASSDATKILNWGFTR